MTCHARLSSALLAISIGLGVVWACPALAQTEPAGLGIRLLHVPQDRAEDPRARASIIDHVPPATTIQRDVEVSNETNDTAEVALYSARANLRDDAFVPAPGQEQNDLSSWITVDPPSVTMQPGGRVTATLRIDVPADAAPGERYAIVLADRGAPDDVPDGAVGAVARVGIRVYLSVGPGAEPASDFEIQSMTAVSSDDGGRVVAVDVANTGGRALDFAGDLHLTDGPDGLRAGPFDVEPGTTLGAGEAGTVRVSLGDEIPDGPWTASVRLTSGALVSEAASALLFPSEPGVAEPASVRSADRRAPLVLGLIALVLAGLGGLTFALRDPLTRTRLARRALTHGGRAVADGTSRDGSTAGTGTVAPPQLTVKAHHPVGSAGNSPDEKRPIAPTPPPPPRGPRLAVRVPPVPDQPVPGQPVDQPGPD